jgi:Arc/MetJ-type ribon-helix-helix transcriptional regulator
MTIHLSVEQERAIQEAIKSGFIRSVDEFIEIAIAMLPQRKDQDKTSRQDAIRRMEEFGQKYHLSMGEPVSRNLLHEGHRY